MITDQNPRTQDILAWAGDRSGEQVQFDRVLNLTADGTVVEENDEAAVFRLVGVGGSLPASLVTELGIGGGEEPAVKNKGGRPRKDASAVNATDTNQQNTDTLNANTESVNTDPPAKSGLTITTADRVQTVTNIGGDAPTVDTVAQPVVADVPAATV